MILYRSVNIIELAFRWYQIYGFKWKGYLTKESIMGESTNFKGV